MAPWRTSAGGRTAAKLRSVSPRTRPATILLPLLLAGPILLAGCAERETSEAASSSSVEQSSDDAATAPAAADTVEDGTSDAPGFLADTEADTAPASPDAAVTVSDIRIGGGGRLRPRALRGGGARTPGGER